MEKKLAREISPYSKSIPRKKAITEKLVKIFFGLNGFAALLFILLIFFFILNEGYKAFNHISITDFIFFEKSLAEGSEFVYQWYPTSEEPKYSILPLIVGSLLTSLPAVIISSILGISVGIYLSEIAGPKVRELLKPVIELFAGLPTVVVGFFMLVVGATFFQELFNPPNLLNAFLASLGLSFIIIPIIASLTDDAMRAVPLETRMASYALGATKWHTITKVVLPGAISGVSAGIILGFGRAIGETMIVLMASGNAAELTFNIFRSVRTMTATIAAEMGEVAQESDHYYALFLIGVVLFLLTFILNIIADFIISKMKKRLSASEIN
jgi:phosphate transport system permease protein